jgi:sterol desaturase/sphingolipid hydroxylase (fatty acid hydroxylase superfamily)
MQRGIERMRLFALEHSRRAYHADFALYGSAVLALAGAVTLGVVAGYLAYAVTHHATHHWRSGNPWLQRRKRRHALHHHDKTVPRCYGVTSAFWDHVFRSALIRAPRQG